MNVDVVGLTSDTTMLK